MRKDLHDLREYIVECNRKSGYTKSVYDYEKEPGMAPPPETLSNHEVFQWWCAENFNEYGVEPGNDDATCPKGLGGLVPRVA